MVLDDSYIYIYIIYIDLNFEKGSVLLALLYFYYYVGGKANGISTTRRRGSDDDARQSENEEQQGRQEQHREPPCIGYQVPRRKEVAVRRNRLTQRDTGQTQVGDKQGNLGDTSLHTMNSSTAGMDPQAIAELRSRIDSHLRQTNIYGQIRDFIRQHQGADDDGKADGAKLGDAVNHALKEKSVLSELVRSLRRPPNLADHSHGQAGLELELRKHGSASASASEVPSPYRRFLLLKVLGGRAFVDHASLGGGHFVLHLHFRNHRCRSRPVPCSIEPAFDESFLLDLQPANSESLVDLATLLSIDSKVHLVLTHVKMSDEGVMSTTLMASYDIEWRKALVAGGVSIPAELLGAGQRAKLRHPIGVLDLRLDVVPAPTTEVPPADIDRGLRASERRSQDLNRQFFQYARLWWKEFVEIDPNFKDRLVKIFAEDVSFASFFTFCVLIDLVPSSHPIACIHLTNSKIYPFPPLVTTFVSGMGWPSASVFVCNSPQRWKAP